MSLVGVTAGILSKVFAVSAPNKTPDQDYAEKLDEIRRASELSFEKIEKQLFPDPFERLARREKFRRENAEYIANGHSCFHRREQEKNDPTFTRN